MNTAGRSCVVTGAGGFVGAALLRRLAADSVAATGWSRRDGFDLEASATASASWTERLRGIDTVIHCAALAHQLNGAAAGRYEAVNRDGTIRLANAAATAGVRRFIFISTAKVFGEGAGGPYTPASPAQPQDAYARSKWEAEQALGELAARGQLQVTIIRPPLVYGPGVGANFARLATLARIPLPLPVAAVRNRRDLIGIDNLVDLIVHCLDHPAAANATLLCSDGQPYSLADLLGQLRTAADRPRWLFPLPAGWVEALAGLALAPAAHNRLFGDFELDIGATCALLDWRPPVAMSTVLRRMAAGATS